jgi:hypothetical protein
MTEQPVLVIEIPREFCHSTTSSKYFDQKKSVLELNVSSSFRRWQFIGKFLIVHANFQQVLFFLLVLSFLFPPKLTTFFPIFPRHTLPLALIFPIIR